MKTQRFWNVCILRMRISFHASHSQIEISVLFLYTSCYYTFYYCHWILHWFNAYNSTGNPQIPQSNRLTRIPWGFATFLPEQIYLRRTNTRARKRQEKMFYEANEIRLRIFRTYRKYIETIKTITIKTATMEKWKTHNNNDK